MKYKLHDEIKDSFPIPNLLTDDCIKRLNLLFGMHITKEPKGIKVNLPEETRFKFFDRLMRKNQTL